MFNRTSDRTHNAIELTIIQTHSHTSSQRANPPRHTLEAKRFDEPAACSACGVLGASCVAACSAACFASTTTPHMPHVTLRYAHRAVCDDGARRPQFTHRVSVVSNRLCVRRSDGSRSGERTDSTRDNCRCSSGGCAAGDAGAERLSVWRCDAKPPVPLVPRRITLEPRLLAAAGPEPPDASLAAAAEDRVRRSGDMS